MNIKTKIQLAPRDPRSPQIYRALTDPHFPVIPWKRNACRVGETEVNRRWQLDLGGNAPEMVRVAGDDLARFLADSFGVTLAAGTRSEASIRVRVDPSWAGSESKREHDILVARDGIKITGVSEWGAACGLYHLQRLMRLNRAPRLAIGTVHARPALDPSLTWLAFKRTDECDFCYPTAYHEQYLRRIARAGYTGFHLVLAIESFYRSEILPELNCDQAAQNLATLRQIVRESRRCALEVYGVIYVRNPLPADHPVFRKHPGVRGSAILFTGGRHILCSSHPITRRFYAEQAVRIVRETGLAGLVFIVGGEGLLHCYTAPETSPLHNTDCPRCSKKYPEESIAELVNGIAGAVKRERADARVVIWPYCSATWTKTSDAKDLAARLSPDCDFMGNFDTGDRCRVEGGEAVFSDYSLTCVGPSREFRAQTSVAARRGLKILAKLESGCPREIHNVPSIPANTRWARKYAQVLKSGVTGAMWNWEFTGYTEEIAGELAGWMSWQPCLPARELLRRLAARDFGERNADAAMKAWRCFDRAMEFFPFSAFVTDFARGPFFIGFTQPLIFDPHQPGELSPQFWMKPGDARAAGPLFDMDLKRTHPFGSEPCLRALRKTERNWARGCAALEESASPEANDPAAARKLDQHRALGRGILCSLRTAINMVRFYLLRDLYLREPSNLRVARRRLTALRNIAKEELANTEEGFACMRRNPLIGHDYANGWPFTEEMAKSKIAHTRRLIEQDLPLRMFVHSITMFSRDEWLYDDGKRWRRG